MIDGLETYTSPSEIDRKNTREITPTTTTITHRDNQNRVEIENDQKLDWLIKDYHQEKRCSEKVAILHKIAQLGGSA